MVTPFFVLRFRLAGWVFGAAVALWVTACGTLLGRLPVGEPADGGSFKSDAGGDAGAADSGDAGFEEPAFDAGISDAGFDDGYTGDGGPFAVAAMPLDAMLKYGLSVSGLSPDDVYAVAASTDAFGGRLLHYDGNANGEWVPVFDSDPSKMLSVEALPALGAVAVVTRSQVAYCHGDCADGGAYQFTADPMVGFISSCASDSEAYALGEDFVSYRPLLWRSRGGSWTPMATFPTMQWAWSCGVAADGTVWLGGNGEVGLAFPDGGSRVDTVVTGNWSGSSTSGYYVVSPVGASMLLTAGWSVVEFTPIGDVTRVFVGDAFSGNARAVGSAHSDELFVVGGTSGSNHNPPPLLRRYKGHWHLEPTWEGEVEWADLWFASQDEFFAVGRKEEFFGKVIGARISHGRR